MSEEDLRATIKVFAEASKQHYAYTLEGDHIKINLEAGKVAAAYKVIIDHGEIGKAMLLRLLQDTDLVVAFSAAVSCMHFAPDACKKIIKQASKDRGILGLEAKYALKRFEDGTWQQEIS